jgi:hypothetical protein
MGNTVLGYCVNSRWQYTGSTCPGDFLLGSPAETLVLWILSLVRFIIWLGQRAISLIIASWTAFSGIIGLLFGSWYYLIALVSAWILWWLAADLFLYTAYTVFPTINFIILLTNFSITLASQFVLIYQRLWNSVAPQYGLWFSVIFGATITFWTMVYKIIGERLIMTLFNLFMARLTLQIKIYTAIFQVIVSAAPAVLDLLGVVIGPIMKLFMSVLSRLFPALAFLLNKLLPGIQPIFKALLWTVKTVKDIFGMFYAARMLLAVGELPTMKAVGDVMLSQQSPHDDVHGSLIKQLANEVRLVFTEEQLHEAHVDAAELARYIRTDGTNHYNEFYELWHPVWRERRDNPELDPSQRHLFEQLDQAYAEAAAVVAQKDDAEIAEDDNGEDGIQITDTPRADDYDADDYDNTELDEASLLIQPRNIERRLAQPPAGEVHEIRGKRPITAKEMGVEPSHYNHQHHKNHKHQEESIFAYVRGTPAYKAVEKMMKGGHHRGDVFVDDSQRRRGLPHNEYCDTATDKLCARHAHRHPFEQIAQSPSNNYSPPGTHDDFVIGSSIHKAGVVGGAVGVHAVHAVLRYLHESSDVKLFKKAMAYHGNSAFRVMTGGHDSLGSWVHHLHTNYGHGYDVLHENVGTVADWSIFNLPELKLRRPTRNNEDDPNKFEWTESTHFSFNKRSDPAHLDRPFLSDFLKTYPVKKFNRVHPDTGETYSTYEWEDGLGGEVTEGLESGPLVGAVRHLLGRLPFLTLLASTDCYTTSPRNPLCVPDFVPDGFRLDIALIDTPKIFTSLSEVCEMYFYQPTRRVPRGTELYRWQTWVDYLTGPVFLGPMRIWNGFIWMLIVTAQFFDIIAFDIEFFGISIPLLRGIADFLLILAPGDGLGLDMVACLTVHIYDVLIFLFYAVIFGFIIRVIWGEFWAIVESWGPLRAAIQSNYSRSYERRATILQSQLYDESYDTSWNEGLRDTGDHNYNNRNAMGMVRNGIPLNPAAQEGPLGPDTQMSDATLRQKYGNGTNVPYYADESMMNPTEQREFRASWVTGPDGQPQMRYMEGFEAPLYPAPVDAPLMASAAAPPPQLTDGYWTQVNNVAVFKHNGEPRRARPGGDPEAPLLAPPPLPPASVTLSPSVLWHMAELLKRSVDVWGLVTEEISPAELDDWMRRNRFWMRTCEGTMDWIDLQRRNAKKTAAANSAN